MIFVATMALVSLILFCAAGAVFARAAATPPLDIRTESRRSPAEYAHHRQQSTRRRGGYVLVMAGTVTLGVCLTMAVMFAVSD